MAEPELPHRPNGADSPSTSPSRPEPIASQTPPDQPQSCIDNLAQRSTGLPGGPVKRPGAASDETSLWKWAGIGLQFGGTVVLFLLIGRWIDHHFGWNYGATLALLAVALIGNFYLLIKETMKMDK
jgi:hypothetical protein